MTLTVRRLSKFKKDYRLCVKRGYDMQKLHRTVDLLVTGKALEPHYKDHSLRGEYKDCRECHIEPDWLLIYMLTESELVLVRSGTHADLFE